VDIYISNAGISMWAPFEEVKDLGIFRRLIEVNYLGAVHGAHFALPYLQKSCGQFAAIASIQSKVAVPYHTGYVASKHALEGFCEALRCDLEGKEVNVLTVYPHWIRGTDMRANACSADGKGLKGSGRSHNRESITPEECSKAVLEALGKRKGELIIPNKLKLVPWLKLLWPGYLRRKIQSMVKGQGK
jgi:short-subunit dehydrogenase